jgi:hypothetical protein
MAPAGVLIEMVFAGTEGDPCAHDRLRADALDRRVSSRHLRKQPVTRTRGVPVNLRDGTQRPSTHVSPRLVAILFRHQQHAAFRFPRRFMMESIGIGFLTDTRQHTHLRWTAE